MNLHKKNCYAFDVVTCKNPGQFSRIIFAVWTTYISRISALSDESIRNYLTEAVPDTEDVALFSLAVIDSFIDITGYLAVMSDRNPWLEHEAIPFQKYRKLLFEKRYLALYEVRGSIKAAKGIPV
jgi:hypothetical protein